MVDSYPKRLGAVLKAKKKKVLYNECVHLCNQVNCLFSPCKKCLFAFYFTFLSCYKTLKEEKDLRDKNLHLKKYISTL